MNATTEATSMAALIAALPTLGSAIQGGTYVGLLSEAKTGRPYLLLDMGPAESSKTWDEAIDLQTEGQSLPTAVEGAVLYEAGRVKRTIWLVKPYASYGAWVQHSHGDQYVCSRTSEFSAVFVRRLFLDSFDPS